MPRSWRVKLGVTSTLVAFVFTTSGCFGGFNLTRKVYSFNRTVSPDKWVRELVFLAFVILPVYGLASLIDALIINSIEFWTGSNPVTVGKEPVTKVVQQGDTRLIETMAATLERRTMTVEEYRKDALVKTVVVRQEAGQPSVTTEVRYPDGRVETYVTSLEADGSATIGSVDGEGRGTTRAVTAADVRALGDRIAALAPAAEPVRLASGATRAW